MAVTLEVSASDRARCRAYDDCVYVQANSAYGNAITADLRICLHGVKTMAWWGRTKHYYHVKCFASMMDLASLIPEKFKLDRTSGGWGMMVEKWFEHSGRIDLDKIAQYLKDFDAFGEAVSEYYKWENAHAQNCKGQEAECRCPPRPDRPSEPELGDCTKEDRDACTLLDLLEHRFAMKSIRGW